MKKPTENAELVQKKEDQEISLPKIINSEVNLLVFPFFVLDRKERRKRAKIEYKDVVKRGDKKIRFIKN